MTISTEPTTKFNTSTIINLPDLEAITTESGRLYKTPKGLYPSVTTVLDKTTDHSFLEDWKDRIGVDEAEKIAGQARVRGEAVHKMCEKYLLGESHLDGQMPVNVDLFKRLKPHIDLNISDIYGIETPLYSDYLRIAGRSDLVARWNGKRSIIDFKTSRYPKKEEFIKSYFLQTSLYAVMFEERTGIPITQLVIVIGVDFDTPQIFIKKRNTYIYEAMELIQNYYKEYPNV